jgi:hypothetical protein
MGEQLKFCLSPARLDLKIGTWMMLVNNVDVEEGMDNVSGGGVVAGFR